MPLCVIKDKSGHILESLPGKCVFIAGSEKNAGKTTFLNFALKLLSQSKKGFTPAIMSIGIDGEETDGIFGNSKPRITTEIGNLFVSSENALENSGAEYEIINVYTQSTAIGRPVLAKALRRGEVEISGPENNDGLSGIISDMVSAGADTVFIDGAADRITHSGIMSGIDCGSLGLYGSVLAYIARITPENINSAINNMKLLSAASQCRIFRQAENNIPSENIIRIAGAATEMKVEKTLRVFAENHEKNADPILVFDAPSSVFLPWISWRRLSERYEIFFTSKPDDIFFVVNLYNVSRIDFERKFNLPHDCKIIYNLYEA